MPPVLGQAHAPGRRLLGLLPVGIVLAAVLVLALPAIGGADATPSADALRREDASLAARSHAAALSLYSLDSQLAAARARLAALEARQATLLAERASLARELRIARGSVSVSQRRLATHLRELYERSDVSTVEVVLGARTLDEALTGLDSLDRAAAQDEAVAAEVRAAKRRVSAASAAVAARIVALDAARRQAEATEASLRRAQEERLAYVARLAAERELNARQLAHVEAQAPRRASGRSSSPPRIHRPRRLRRPSLRRTSLRRRPLPRRTTPAPSSRAARPSAR